jgi:AraC-like DNA-binding protein
VEPGTAHENSLGLRTVERHNQAVERVIAAMHERLDQPFPLRDMSQTAFISRFHFIRTFRRITGIPPRQFLYALRLDSAKRLLMTTDRSVIDICYDVGYNSLGSFTRRFTDLFGISPTRFRSLARSATCLSIRAEGRLLHERPAQGHTIMGRVTAPPGFEGLIFIGLFGTPMPQGKPVACDIVLQPGPYEIGCVPDGRFYLFAAAFGKSDDSKAFLDFESALRAGGQRISVRGGVAKGSTELSLRPPEPSDPPMLLTLPLLAKEYLGGSRGIQHEIIQETKTWEATP